MPAHLNAAPGHAVSAAQNILHPAAAGASGQATATDTPAGDSASSFAALFRQLAAQPSGGDAGQIMLALQETPVTATESTTAMTDALSALLPFLEGMGMIQPEGETAAEDAQAALPGSEDLAGVLAVPLTPAAAITAAAGVSGEKPAEGNHSAATLATLTTATTASTASTAADAPDAGIAGLQDDQALPAITATGNQAQTTPQETQSGRGRDFAAQLVAAIENGQKEGSRTPGSTAHAVQQVIAATPSNGHTASSAVSPLQITQPVGTSGWGEEVGNRVVWMANRQESRAELVLTPPQMGRVEVSLTISGDQASANFVSANPAVREALEAALPRLREVLADAGIQLGQAQVGAENPGQSARGDKNDDNPAFDRTGPRHAGPLQMTEVGMAPDSGLKSGRGLVDVFA
jgi:flagellar hook-length control protein FliK